MHQNVKNLGFFSANKIAHEKYSSWKTKGEYWLVVKKHVKIKTDVSKNGVYFFVVFVFVIYGERNDEGDSFLFQLVFETKYKELKVEGN